MSRVELLVWNFTKNISSTQFTYTGDDFESLWQWFSSRNRITDAWKWHAPISDPSDKPRRSVDFFRFCDERLRAKPERYPTISVFTSLNQNSPLFTPSFAIYPSVTRNTTIYPTGVSFPLNVQALHAPPAKSHRPAISPVYETPHRGVNASFFKWTWDKVM
jgi:hypothetical protein